MQGSSGNGSAKNGAQFGQVPAVIAAAHELKSPLALIRQLSLLLQDDECTPAQIDQIAERLTLTSERALRLTNDLTRASRLDDSFFDVEPLNPQTLLEEVAHELYPLYKANGKELIVRANRSALLAVANRDLLRRILLNFTDNALHYSTAAAPVILSAGVSQGGIRMSVRDFGPAIPKNLCSATQPYALSGRPESSGLGLYITHQFAEAMGAHIGTVRHRDGASFYVDLIASTQLRLV